ncbi:MAG: hypothetical protein COB30_009250 [Ectothiorhodospiraceae bacterium]|nr:hypothetical protein [Ectothiorhodospiraceae bacterium]
MVKKSVYAIASLFLVTASPVFSSVIGITEYSSFISASEFGSTSLQHTGVGPGIDDYTGAGLDVVFTNSLGADNIGSVSWQITNSTGSVLNDVSFFGFLDAQIDEATNTFFNETASAAGFTLGSGSGDSQPDSFEIDEPGYLFGDIFTNLLNGSLDNTNALLGIEDDVSLALGFDVGTLLSDESILASFEISEIDNGGLYQYDAASDYGFYFLGVVSIIDDEIEIPNPSTLFLMSIGFLAIGGVKAGKHKRMGTKVC